MKRLFKSLVVLGMVATANAGVTIHFKLDCRTGVREPAAEGDELRYDANWYENGDSVRITDNGVFVTNGVCGECTWRPEPCSVSNHVLKLAVISEGQVVGTETAQFKVGTPLMEHATIIAKPAIAPTSGTPGMTAEVRCSRCGEIIQAATEIPALGYIRNVTARQLWPHNKVALEFTLVDDVGEVECPGLHVWCARSGVTNEASCLIGDRSARPGLHRIVWDMEADGLCFVDAKAIFGVEVKSEAVQLWENGPYWAKCNVGASKPEEYGYYFWWGDTVGYKRNAENNGWISVKDGAVFSFSAGNCPTYYTRNSALLSDGYIDSSGNLVAAHDAATAHLGAPWRMPTDAEFAALINNCDTTWTTLGGVYGRLVTGRGAYASKSIFLPAAGDGYHSGLYDTGSLGLYWSSTPNSGSSHYTTWSLTFTSSYFFRNDIDRYYGRSVRPLRGFAQ